MYLYTVDVCTQGRRDQQTQMCCERERETEIKNLPFTSAIFVMCAGTPSPSQIAGYWIILPEKEAKKKKKKTKRAIAILPWWQIWRRNSFFFSRIYWATHWVIPDGFEKKNIDRRRDEADTRRSFIDSFFFFFFPTFIRNWSDVSCCVADDAVPSVGARYRTGQGKVRFRHDILSFIIHYIPPLYSYKVARRGI